MTIRKGVRKGEKKKIENIKKKERKKTKIDR